MTSPAGWYPQEDGRQRYWDGHQWTENFAPGVQPAVPGVQPGPGVQPAPGTPPSMPPAAPHKNWFVRHKLLTAIGAIVLIGVVAGIASTSSTQTETAVVKTGGSAETPTAVTKPAAPVSQLGSRVLDGKFAFTVTAVKCGIAQVGTDATLSKKAQGEFCRVSLTVENTGTEAQPMSDTNQYLFDAKGRKFNADSEAAIYDNSAQLLFEPVNPGNTIKGNIYFDVPKGTDVTKLELHDSPFSDGVTVTL